MADLLHLAVASIFIIGFGLIIYLWLVEHNKGKLYINSVITLRDVEDRINAHKEKIWTLPEDTVLTLLKERKYLEDLINSYEDR